MLKKAILISLLVGLVPIALSQNKSIGYWTGLMNREGALMNVSFEFKMNDNQLSGFYNSPSQRASGIPLDSIRITNNTLSFQLMTEPVTFFKCNVSENNITGQMVQDGFSNGTLVLNRSSAPVRKFLQTDTTFKSGDHIISCRIYFPIARRKYPAIIFMHGSGAEEMYANQFIAEYLASKGIIALIQDKQGVGKSTGNWMKAGFNDLANDYINAATFLKHFNKVNKLQIGIYGHSQGGTIAPLVASKSKDISFIIAAASVGDSVYTQDLYRVKNNLRSNDFKPNEIEEAMAYYNSWLNMARTGIGFEKLDSLNRSSKDKKWFEWVEAPPREHWIWEYYLKTGNYNSLQYWKNVTIPVMLVYGENDEIEDVKLYIKNIDSVLIGQSHNGDVTRLILPKGQHNLCIEPAKNEKFFWWHISPGYPDMIASWVLYRFKN